MTVNQIGAKTLEEQSVNDLPTALRNTSNVVAYTNYGIYEYYQFRGMSTPLQMTDGIRNEGNRINTQTNNVERVEVLKGPASVLFGGGGLAGAINLVRKTPSGTRRSEISIAGGTWNTQRVAGGTTGRLWSDRWLYRLDGGYDYTDTFRRAPNRRVNVTPSLYANLNSRDRLTFHMNFNRDRFATDSGIPLVGRQIPAVPFDRRFSTPRDFALTHDYNIQAGYTRRLGESTEFRNTFSYRKLIEDYLSAETLGVLPGDLVRREFLYFKHHRGPILNQTEITTRVKFGVDHKLLGGYEFQRFANFTNRTDLSGTTAPPVSLYNPVETYVSSPMKLTRIDRFAQTIHPLYFQDHITWRRLSILIAGRYDIYRRWSRNDPVANGVVGEGPTLRRAAEAFTTRLGAVYRTASWHTFHGSFATAFLPLTQIPADGRNLDPETGRQFEIGQRFEFFAGRVTIQNAFFQILRRNVAFSRGGGVFDQAGRQDARGGEIDITADLVRGWRANASYGLTGTTFDQFLSGNLDLSGRRPRQVSRHTANLWLSRSWRNGIGVNLGTRYRSSFFGDNANLVRLGGFTIWDAGVGWRRGRWEYSANALNAFNKRRYVVATQYDYQIFPGNPFQLMLSTRFRF